MKYLILCLLLILNLLAKGSDDNVISVYNLSVDNPSYTNKNTYSKELNKFMQRYPYIAPFIINKESFEFFRNRYQIDNKIINNTLKRIFNNKDQMEKRNLGYVILALDFSSSQLDSKELIYTIKKLKNRYSLDDLKYVLSFWITFKLKYGLFSEKKKKVTSFQKALKIYGISVLKRYSHYADDFYSTLLPENFHNYNYMKTINALIVAIKSSKLERQSYFLKMVSLDIQIALENGNKQREIVNYFKEFAKRDFTLQFKTLDCHQLQGIAFLVSDNLDYKLDWLKNNPEFFYTIIKMINNQKSNRKIINILGLYNYASVIYSKMETFKQKEMFKNIITLPTDSMLFNLSLIYALGNHTEYFAAIINQNNNMYENDKYKEILYISRNNKNMLNLFKDGNIGLFAKEIDDLVSTPYVDIHNLTGGEKVIIALKVVDYTSYATTIIPGVGIGMQIARALTKATIKGVIKQGIKITVKNSLKFIKNQKKDLKNYNIQYVENQNVNKKIEIVRNELDKALCYPLQNTNLKISMKKRIAKKIRDNIKNYFTLPQKQKKLCTQKIK